MAFAAVKRVFLRFPLASNCAVYGTLYVGAEFSQQTINKKIIHPGEQTLPYDKSIIARYGLLGAGLYPTIYYFWYRWLDRRYVGTAATIIVKKLALDQFLLTPPLLVIFYVSMSLMEQKSDLLEECRNKLIPTFKTSCLFWLPAQSLNFLLVPPAARVVYVGSCAFVWVNILCWFKRQTY